MKIKKTYQGAVPLNRISNQKDNSELNTYSTQYLNNKLVYVGLEQPTDGEEVWIQKGKNLLYTSYDENNKLSITATKDDYYIHTNYNCYLEEGKTYAVSFESDGEGGGQAGTDTVQIWLLKDNEYTYKYSFSSKAMTFTPEASGYYYLRFDVNKNATTHSFWNIQVEQGTTATSYESYVDKKIFLKNDNGNYEEMINASEVNVLIPRKIYPSFNWDYIYTTDLQYTCFKVGRMVFLNIHTMGFHVSPENGATIISNLPPTVNNAHIGFYFEGGLGDGAYSCRCLVTPGGTIQIHWGSPTQIGDSANKQYRCFLMYETND